MMEDKTKYYIFDRKEIALVFAFIISIAVTAFLIGVKVGSDYSYQMSDLTPAEKTKVDLLSSEEEDVIQLVENAPGPSEVAANKNANSEVLDIAYEKLKKEFAKLDENAATGPEDQNDIAPTDIKPDIKPNNKEYTGKFTIQIGSHRSSADAEKFAGGFRARGYQPIINDVELAGGTWYRVSLGIFNTIAEAKNYIVKEQALFQGQDYIIYKFD